jgi:nucleotide-binding universal stress UspA family protein
VLQANGLITQHTVERTMFKDKLVKGILTLRTGKVLGRISLRWFRRRRRAGAVSFARNPAGAAQEIGVGLLVMGGFGHSRMRDFVLGGATGGIVKDLRLPVLLSH